ncbi:hypothetical protein JIR001_24020 [Polycladomyces abyssicola]|uniref:Uncharacterized protein n=1 Tax=Polycladomyces abyssicola TaxID=1125966 RepID=A0A8D5ZLK4_9BACL|nr:hypothetical protein JIR001_24020 [Polycladomyces abyssicola]
MMIALTPSEQHAGKVRFALRKLPAIPILCFPSLHSVRALVKALPGKTLLPYGMTKHALDTIGEVHPE